MIASFLRRLGIFRQALGWLIADLWRLAWGRLLVFLALNFIGTATRTAAFLTVFLYVKAHVDGRPIAFGGVAVPSEPTAWTMLGWGGVAMGFALLTALATYSSGAMGFALARRYMEHASARVLHILGGSRSLELPADHETHESPLLFARRLLGGGMIMLMRMILAMLSVVGPLLMVIVAVAALALIHLPLTAAVAVVVVGYFIPLYLFNLDLVRASRAREVHSRKAGAMLSRFLAFIVRSRYAAGTAPDWSRSYLRSEPFRRGVDAFRTVILTRKKVGAMNDAALGVALLVLLVSFGVFMGGEGGQWSLLLAYLIALSAAATNLSMLAVALTAINRLLPQAARYVAFRRANELREDRREEGTEGSSAEWIEFRVSEPMLPGSQESCRPGPGDVLLVTHPMEIDRYTFDEFLAAMTSGAAARPVSMGRSAFLQGSGSAAPMMSLRELVFGSMPALDDRESMVRDAFDQVGLREEYDQLPDGMDTVLNEDALASLSPLFQCVVGLLHGLIIDYRYIVLRWEVIGRVDASDQAALLGLFADRVVMLVAQKAPGLLPAGVDLAMIVDESGVHGIGGDAEWYRAVRNAATNERPAESGWSAEEEDQEIEAVL